MLQKPLTTPSADGSAESIKYKSKGNKSYIVALFRNTCIYKLPGKSFDIYLLKKQFSQPRHLFCTVPFELILFLVIKTLTYKGCIIPSNCHIEMYKQEMPQRAQYTSDTERKSERKGTDATKS